MDENKTIKAVTVLDILDDIMESLEYMTEESVRNKIKDYKWEIETGGIK